jgi:hypothetical protein
MSLRESVRAALSGATQAAWPQGQTRIAVDDLIEAGRQLDHAARRGEPVDRAEALKIVRNLSEYISGLSPHDQAETAWRLVAELTKPMRVPPPAQPPVRGVFEVEC